MDGACELNETHEGEEKNNLEIADWGCIKRSHPSKLSFSFFSFFFTPLRPPSSAPASTVWALLAASATLGKINSSLPSLPQANREEKVDLRMCVCVCVCAYGCIPFPLVSFPSSFPFLPALVGCAFAVTLRYITFFFFLLRYFAHSPLYIRSFVPSSCFL